MKIGILGAGSWGTALTVLLSDNGHDITVWSVDEKEIEMLDTKREHLTKLPGVKLPDSVRFTTDEQEVWSFHRHLSEARRNVSHLT